jgi:hypothetical protein
VLVRQHVLGTNIRSALTSSKITLGRLLCKDVQCCSSLCRRELLKTRLTAPMATLLFKCLRIRSHRSVLNDIYLKNMITDLVLLARALHGQNSRLAIQLSGLGALSHSLSISLGRTHSHTHSLSTHARLHARTRGCTFHSSKCTSILAVAALERSVPGRLAVVPDPPAGRLSGGRGGSKGGKEGTASLRALNRSNSALSRKAGGQT